MNNHPYIARIQVVFDFSLNVEIRKKVFEFEEALSPYFKTPFNVLSIPDQAPPEISRFQAVSHNGHSRLEVSQLRITLTTLFDDVFRNDFEKIKEYFKERVVVLHKLIVPENMHFLAYIMEVGYSIENDKINSLLKSSTGVKAINEQTIDFSLHYSIPFKEKYFINIKCSKYVAYNVEMDLINQTSKSLSPNDTGISIQIDLNSKLNYNKLSKFEAVLFSDIQQNAFETVEKNHLENYLTGVII